MVWIFRDFHGTVVDLTPPDATVIVVAQRATLRHLEEATGRRRLGLLTWGVLLLHDNARQNTAHTTTALLDLTSLNTCLSHTIQPRRWTSMCFGGGGGSKIGDFCLTTQSKSRSRSSWESRSRPSTARAWMILYALACASASLFTLWENKGWPRHNCVCLLVTTSIQPQKLHKLNFWRSVLFNDSCQLLRFCSVGDRWVNMEHWWCDPGWQNPKY